MTRVLVPVAGGSEEMEAVIVVDMLLRAKRDVVVAGVKEGPITASRGGGIVPDTTMDRKPVGCRELIERAEILLVCANPLFAFSVLCGYCVSSCLFVMIGVTSFPVFLLGCSGFERT